MRRAGILGLMLVLWAGVACAAGDVAVELTVEEPIGAARTNEVVSGGIPFPEGACKVLRPTLCDSRKGSESRII
jgi:hypothetical protein